MRRTTGVLCTLLLGLSLVACGGGDTGDNGSSGDELSAEEQAIEFSKCMRDNGVENFPDPDENGGINLDADKLDATPDEIEAAEQKCKKFMPNGGEPQKVDPKTLKQLREYSECMRDNGIENYPDPEEDGGIKLDGDEVDPNDPAVKAAEKKCKKFLPGGGEGGTTNEEKG